MSSLELFNTGQYAQLLIQEDSNNRPDNLSEQLIKQNNKAVLLYVQEKNASHRLQMASMWSQCLQTCASVPATLSVIHAELSALYNVSYSSLLVDVNFDKGLAMWIRTLTRFHWCLQGKHVTPIPPDEDLHERCVQLLNTCTSLIWCYSNNREVLQLYCHCVWIWGIYELASNRCLRARDLWSSLAQNLLAVGDLSTHPKQPICKPALCLPLFLDHRQVDTSPDQVLQITGFLEGIAASRLHQYDRVLSLLEMVTQENMALFAKFVTGYALWRQARFSESISVLMEVVRSRDLLTPRMEARVHCLIGCCFSKMDKVQLSIATYKEALCCDFSYLRPLYLTAGQYRLLEQHDLELECLNLLVTALEMREETVSGSLDRLDVMSLVEMGDSDIQYSQALYSMASRAAQLNRHDVSAEKYTELLKYLTSYKATAVKECESLPPLRLLHHEATESLLNSHRYTECLDLCDHMLACCHGDTGILQCSKERAYSALNKNHDGWKHCEFMSHESSGFEMLTEDLEKELGERSQGCSKISDSWKGFERPHVYKKKKMRDTDGNISDENHCKTDPVALKLKGLCLLKLGKPEAAFACVQSAIDAVSLSRAIRIQAVIKDLQEPPTKQRRLTASTSPRTNRLMDNDDSQSDSVALTGQCIRDNRKDDAGSTHAAGIKLELELYQIAADILKSINKQSDARHFIRLSAELKLIE
ncbi:uncharacterized protein LOC127848868 [Dreissena polymorpha]|uniref:Uncharacterized protein n=1 Tax=Dreissena polymorpha TaxID=45954 RepID=A0A9D4N8A6_DREPO|nr:uncharacterized protein LOC127848868 [Dreissena polymorpha]XP_052237503.1 uncharacterized protein LOC127848868 [Dreissena polymorpha]XP_052237509.1 uncharacterized protein LOC127848868 [Dreissena polymorpha]KAH3889059.1 hypothetical protein DPMN_013107 [Dreissena polymorpha]